MSEKFSDPVVAEVHAARAAMLAAAGGSIADLMHQVAEHQRRSSRRIIREPLPNRPEPTDAREAAIASGIVVESVGPPA